MPYRGDVHALEARRVALEKALADVRVRARELAETQQTEAALAAELASVARMLGDIASVASLPAKRSLPMLDDIRIASPCSANWDDMVVDAKNAAVRFCGQCAKNVYNLSDMTKADAESVLREKEGKLCARVYRRDDGTVITADCPVGVRRRRVRRVAVSAVGGGMLAFAGVMLMRGSSVRMGDTAMQGKVETRELRPMMGDIEPTTPEPVAETGTTAVMGTVAPMKPPPPAKKPLDVAKPKPAAR
jgi:hypothetical protein